MNAAKIVTDALLGCDEKAISMAGKVYVVKPPTIRTLARAASHLCKTVGEGLTIKDVMIDTSNLQDAVKALSVFICGDESLSDELLDGTYDELVHGLDVAYSQLSIENFCRLSALRKSVSKLIARQKL